MNKKSSSLKNMRKINPQKLLKNPDLNPLDYSFWSQAMAKVWKDQPKSIEELVFVVEEFFASCTEDFVKKVVENVLK